MIGGKQYRLSEPLPPWDILRAEPGVYVILSGRQNGRPRALNRIAGRDKGGILYIGKSDNLRSRLGALRRMIYEGARAGHIAGITYRKSRPIRRICPPDSLHFGFVHCADCVEREHRELRRYVSKYCETPPLNAVRGQKDYV